MTTAHTPHVAFRDIRPCDRDALADLFARTSPESRAARFMGGVAEIPAGYLADLICSECATISVGAFATTATHEMLGVASASPDVRGQAELAVWVADAWQQRGIGSALLAGVLRRLTGQGYTRAYAYVASSNRPALGLLHRIAPTAEYRRTDASTVTVLIDVRQPDGLPKPLSRRRKTARDEQAVSESRHQV